jgi:hypothetical protein
MWLAHDHDATHSTPARLAIGFALLLGPVGALGACVTPVAAQSWRAELAFLDTWRPAVAVAYEWRTPIGGEPPLPGPDTPGPVFSEVRDWLLSAMLGAGVTFARVKDADVSPTAMAQVGVLRRLPGGLEPRGGIYAFGAVRPEGFGPVLRFEVKDVIGIQAGWVWFSGGSRSGVVATADVSCALIGDLLR